MTDEEINRRVAEIEGWGLALAERWIDGPPPYVTNWTWIGPALEKAISKYGAGFMERVVVLAHDEDRSFKKSICLALIEAHGGGHA